jgi:hypothetical protein
VTARLAELIAANWAHPHPGGRLAPFNAFAALIHPTGAAGPPLLTPPGLPGLPCLHLPWP